MPLMKGWFWYAIGAAILYGLHQVFTKLAAHRIADGIGGFIVEATAAASILAYLVFLFLSGQWNQQASVTGIAYSMLTGVCVGAGTVFFFLLFQKGGPLSAVPMVLAGGAALMAIVGIVVFHEQASWPRLLGIALSIAGLYLLRM
jgi:transporter family protein